MCNEFMEKFSKLYNDTGLYKDVIQWVFEEIKKVDGVKDLVLGEGHNAHDYLISKDESLAVYKRSIRLECE